MVSEGVDIPRLAVGVYATTTTTPLFFAQAVGRFVRARRRGETASIFLPSVPTLLQHAALMEEERDHVLGRVVHDEDDLFAAERDLLARAEAEQSEAGLADGTFEALESAARFDRVVFDGGEFGHLTEAGSQEEHDYLGLPGLLEPDQVAVLLKERQAQQAKQSASTPAAARPSTFRSVADLRRELSGLVAAWHHRTGQPHATIHGDLRAACGGPAGAAGGRRRPAAPDRHPARMGGGPALGFGPRSLACQVEDISTHEPRRPHAHRPLLSSALLSWSPLRSPPSSRSPPAPRKRASRPPPRPARTPAPTSSTVKDGTITVGTSDPAFPPYVIDNKPTNGKGFESATAYAVAKEMGFDADQVEWTFANFSQLFAPGEKDFDFALNQISITPKREEAVTFSDPYYEASNGVLVLKDSEFADVTTLAELQDAKIGVQIGTTALEEVETQIAPTQEVAVFDDTTASTQALANGQIDAIITDLPTTLYLAAVEVPGTVIGQLPAAAAADSWGLVLEMDNPLVTCVNQAVDCDHRVRVSCSTSPTSG